MDTSEQTTILLDIYSRLGSIESTLKARAEVEADIRSDIAVLSSQVDSFKEKLNPVIATVTAMKPEHDVLVRFHGRVGGVLAVSGLIATSAGYLLWEGLKYLAGRYWTH